MMGCKSGNRYECSLASPPYASAHHATQSQQIRKTFLCGSGEVTIVDGRGLEKHDFEIRIII